MFPKTCTLSVDLYLGHPINPQKSTKNQVLGIKTVVMHRFYRLQWHSGYYTLLGSAALIKGL